MVSIATLDRVSPNVCTQAILFDQTPVLEAQVAKEQQAAFLAEQRQATIEAVRQDNLDWARHLGLLGATALN